MLASALQTRTHEWYSCVRINVCKAKIMHWSFATSYNLPRNNDRKRSHHLQYRSRRVRHVPANLQSIRQFSASHTEPDNCDVRGCAQSTYAHQLVITSTKIKSKTAFGSAPRSHQVPTSNTSSSEAAVVHPAYLASLCPWPTSHVGVCLHLTLETLHNVSMHTGQ